MTWPLLMLRGLNSAVLVYFIVVNAVYLTTSIVAVFALRRYAARLRSLDLADTFRLGGSPPVTVIAPAYNESATCVQSVRALMTLEYAEYEVVVVNDGSRDATLERLVEAFDLVPAPRAPTSDVAHRPIRGIYRSRSAPGLWVIDKENGGKADALNAALAHVRTPLFCAIDVDSLVERDALSRIVRPFLEDDSTVAAGGIIRIANGCTVQSGMVTRVALPDNLVARIQVVEYLRSFLGGRVGWDAMGATLIISGAFGMFKRTLAVSAGGYDTSTVGEDMELVVKLHRYCRERDIPCRIGFVPDPVAWTECPESLRILSRQRERWQRGLAEVMWRHRTMLFNPRYGVIGLVAMPYFFFLEMLGPALEIAGYAAFVVTVLLGRVDRTFVAAFLLLAFALGMSLSLAAISLEELTFRRYSRARQLLTLMLVSLVEGVGYHQLHTWWRFKGLVAAVRRRRGWGEMTRKGFDTAPTG